MQHIVVYTYCANLRCGNGPVRTEAVLSVAAGWVPLRIPLVIAVVLWLGGVLDYVLCLHCC